MAEQRVGIVTGSGDYVRARDSEEQPGGAASKVQLFDYASRHIPNTFYNSPNRSGVSSADGVDLSALSSTAITVGDKSVLAIAVDFNTSGANCIIVPVYYDSNATPQIIGIGEELVFQATTLRRTAAGNYLAPIKMVDVFGATNIRLMVKYLSAGTINVYGEVL
jgi:hypothetical protein